MHGAIFTQRWSVVKRITELSGVLFQKENIVSEVARKQHQFVDTEHHFLK